VQSSVTLDCTHWMWEPVRAHRERLPSRQGEHWERHPQPIRSFTVQVCTSSSCKGYDSMSPNSGIHFTHVLLESFSAMPAQRDTNLVIWQHWQAALHAIETHLKWRYERVHLFTSQMNFTWSLPMSHIGSVGAEMPRSWKPHKEKMHSACTHVQCKILAEVGSTVASDRD
jgi:hypothetical protein